MSISYGFWTDLQGIKLDERGNTWIQAMRVGEYTHPVHGKLQFTVDRLMRFAEGVKNKVRGIDIDIDYDHKMDPVRGREAAGWVRDAKVEGNALWLLVDWTQTAAGKLKEKAYRYFSPEFRDEWTDSAGVKHQDVLFGGGITNRPFLKDLLPLNLSELSFKEEEGMSDRDKQIREKLGLPEDAKDEQVDAKIDELQRSAAPNVDRTATTHAPDQPAGNPPNPGRPAGDNPFDKDPDKKLSELAKTDPVVKMLLEEREANNKRLAELELRDRVSSISVKLSEYAGGDNPITPAVRELFQKVLISAPVALHEDVYAILDLVSKGKATIELGERGSAGPFKNRGGDADVYEELQKRTKKLMETDTNLQYADAAGMVFAEDHGLYQRYQEQSYLFKA